MRASTLIEPSRPSQTTLILNHTIVVVGGGGEMVYNMTGIMPGFRSFIEVSIAVTQGSVFIIETQMPECRGSEKCGFINYKHILYKIRVCTTDRGTFFPFFHYSLLVLRNLELNYVHKMLSFRRQLAYFLNRKRTLMVVLEFYLKPSL